MTIFSRLRTPFAAAQHRYAGHPFRVFKATLQTYICLHIFWDYFYSMGPSGGASMLPTFEVDGDWLVIDKTYRRGRNVKVGDVVQFDSVVDTGGHIVKRVVGLEGDFVMRDTPGSGNETMLQVPRGHCWVIGDNLAASRDSRIFGPIPLGLISGKVVAKFLPWSERRWIANSLEPVQNK